MKKIESLSKNEWALPAVVFIGLCSLFLGKLWIPLAFLLWICFGWKIALSLSRSIVTGTNGVKNAVGIATYVAVIALISALSIVF